MNHFKTKSGIPTGDLPDPAPASVASPSKVKLVLAFAAIYVIWGTTYLAMRIAVDTIPPFTIAGSRFLVAGLCVMAFLRYAKRTPLPTVQQWKSAALIGSLLMIGGNGLVMWAIQKIPSGICAVVIATMPLWMTLFDWLLYKGKRPCWKVATGLLLGLVGIFLLVGPGDNSGEVGIRLHVPSLIALVLAPVFWSIGSLHSRKVDLPDNVFMSVGAQMICGGAILFLLSVLLGEPSQLDLASISLASFSAVAYLTLFGSLIALTSYMWLLRNASASRVSTYSYVNPVIAVCLGCVVLGEQITVQAMLAIAVIVSAVILIVSMQSKS